ncbi:MAG: hypothetical protein GF334_02810 [Candidatus Altiarchaeales archaeon]|nr:hypothetical protein [Candidatus Altiarchaeales archaeon]
MKKLFSLTKTKIRLAQQAHTVGMKPQPLILPEKFFGEKIGGVSEAEKFMQKRKNDTNYNNQVDMAKTSLCLFEIIEKVKYEYEPPRYRPKAGEDEFRQAAEHAKEGLEVWLSIMEGEQAGQQPMVYVGEDPPENCIHLGIPVSTAIIFLAYAIKNAELSEENHFKNMVVSKGRDTLLGSTLYYSLRRLGFRG